MKTLHLLVATDPTPTPAAAFPVSPTEIIQWVAVIGAFIVMVAGLRLTFQRLKELGQGFGANSLRALGTVLFLPTIIILAVASQFHAETLAALLGTIGGYILSRSESEHKATPPEPSRQNTSAEPPPRSIPKA